MDVHRVVPCMPGAELVETIDESHWKLRVRVKLGPVSLTFLTDARREADEGARRVLLRTSAREERGRGAANATIESTLTSGGERTTVTTVTDLTLSGAAAQYSRGLVQGVAEQILKGFADCLEQELTPALGDSERPAPAPQRPVSGFAVGAAAVRAALARLWIRVARRARR